MNGVTPPPTASCGAAGGLSSPVNGLVRAVELPSTAPRKSQRSAAAVTCAASGYSPEVSCTHGVPRSKNGSHAS